MNQKRSSGESIYYSSTVLSISSLISYVSCPGWFSGSGSQLVVIRMYFETQGSGRHAAQPANEFILAATFTTATAQYCSLLLRRATGAFRQTVCCFISLLRSVSPLEISRQRAIEGYYLLDVSHLFGRLRSNSCDRHGCNCKNGTPVMGWIACDSSM